MINIQQIKRDIKQWVTRTAERPFLSVLEDELQDCKTVLDVGCGFNSSLGKIPKTFYMEGIDMLKPAQRNKKIHDKYIKGNINNLTKYFKKKSFDAVIAIDVIEHLNKVDGFELLKNMEFIAKKKVIVLTPYGYMYQGAIGGNPFQIHLSGWYKKDFIKRGYKCFGMHGIRQLRGDEAAIVNKPWYLWLLISHISQYVTYKIPMIAFHLLAIKNLKGKRIKI